MVRGRSVTASSAEICSTASAIAGALAAWVVSTMGTSPVAPTGCCRKLSMETDALASASDTLAITPGRSRTTSRR